MLRVWRVENKKGKGPYRKDVEDWFNLNRDVEEIPLPECEGLPIGGNIICGFSSLKQLRSWFLPDELQRLRLLGFCIRRVEARKVWKGKCQCTFIRRLKR